MIAIARALDEAAGELAQSSDTARLDAEVLLAHVTGRSRSHFRAWPEKPLTSSEQFAFWRLVGQRQKGIPVAYLTGTREFWSREFVVNPGVLIPRPETELLVELALARLPRGRCVSILDMGSGSGALAITLALEWPRARVTAIDLSPDALAVARENAAMHRADNVQFLQSDWFSALQAHERFDLIVSNPPYIRENDIHLSQGDVRFEPTMALASGPSGLNDIRRIVLDAPKHLLDRGWLFIEHGYDQAVAARGLLRQAGFTEVDSYRDLQGHWRVTGGRRIGSSVNESAIL